MQVLLQFMKKILEIMIGIVLEQFRKIENSSRTLEHVFAGDSTCTVCKTLLPSTKMIHLLYNLLLPSVKKKADLRGPTPTSSIPNTPRLPGISQLDTGRGNSRRWPFACRSLAPHQKSTHCCMLSYSDLVTSAATKIHVTFWVFVFSTLLYFNCNVL